MDVKSLCYLLLVTDQFVVEQISVASDEIRLAVESRAHRAECPVCQEESTAVHSTHTRFPTDLAWAEWTVVLRLRVKRFFCRDSCCPKRTFAEQFPGLVARYARRTNRVLARQRYVGWRYAPGLLKGYWVYSESASVTQP